MNEYKSMRKCIQSLLRHGTQINTQTHAQTQTHTHTHTGWDPSISSSPVCALPFQSGLLSGHGLLAVYCMSAQSPPQTHLHNASHTHTHAHKITQMLHTHNYTPLVGHEYSSQTDTYAWTHTFSPTRPQTHTHTHTHAHTHTHWRWRLTGLF